MVAFLTRIVMIWISGWVMGSSWLNDEIKQMLLTDPEIASALQVVLSGAFMGTWAAFWRLAKRWGWTT